jgi:hypothetical protein
MHKKLTTVLLFTSICFATYAQAPDEIDRDKLRTLINTDGKPFVNQEFDIEGSPFYFDKWKYGSIKLISNNVYNNVSVRLNLQSHEVHFLSQAKTEMTVLPDLVKELFIYDTTGSGVNIYDFQCGFPAIDQQTAKDFYLVLSNGKMKLLESIKKEIRQRKDDISGEVKKDFVSYENYYVYSNNALRLVRLNKNSVLQAMNDQQPKIEDYIKANKLSYKSADDLRKIVDYYNTL